MDTICARYRFTVRWLAFSGHFRSDCLSSNYSLSVFQRVVIKSLKPSSVSSFFGQNISKENRSQIGAMFGSSAIRMSKERPGDCGKPLKRLTEWPKRDVAGNAKVDSTCLSLGMQNSVFMDVFIRTTYSSLTVNVTVTNLSSASEQLTRAFFFITHRSRCHTLFPYWPR